MNDQLNLLLSTTLTLSVRVTSFGILNLLYIYNSL